jgi:transcriptional regulator GlxA family with amidase domain
LLIFNNKTDGRIPEHGPWIILGPLRGLKVLSVRIQAAIEIVQNGISGKLDVAMLARQVNMSASRLRHVFKKETGLSPSQYIKLKRLQEAEHLLQTTFLSVKEITHRAGFTNESYFSREFRRTHGLPPGKYRANGEGLAYQGKDGR